MSIEKKKTAKGQPRWEVRFRGLDGKERSKTFTTRADAVAYEQHQRVDLRRGVWTDPRAGKVTLRGWSEDWLESIVDRERSTRRSHESNLRLHILPDLLDAKGSVIASGLGDYPLGKITTAQLTKWLAAMAVKPKLRGEGNLAPAMVHQAYRTLNQCLKSAVLCGHIGRNPLDGVKAPRVPQKPMRLLSTDQVHALADAIDPRFRALVLMGAACGPRIGEMLALRWENIDFRAGTITVVEQLDAYGEHPGGVKPPKTSAGRRSVPMPRFVADALLRVDRSPGEGGEVLALIGAGGRSRTAGGRSGLVFPAPEGGLFQLDNFRRRVWAPAVATAGLNPLRIHDLRHTCASTAIQAGADVKVLQLMLGHASAAVTLDRYGHLMPGQGEAVASRIDAFYGSRSA